MCLNKHSPLSSSSYIYVYIYIYLLYIYLSKRNFCNFARQQVRSIVEIINSGIQPIQNLSVLQRLKAMTGREIAGDLAPDWGGHFIRRGFQGLEPILSESAGLFCVGDEVTMADLCLVPQVFNAYR